MALKRGGEAPQGFPRRFSKVFYALSGLEPADGIDRLIYRGAALVGEGVTRDVGPLGEDAHLDEGVFQAGEPAGDLGSAIDVEQEFLGFRVEGLGRSDVASQEKIDGLAHGFGGQHGSTEESAIVARLEGFHEGELISAQELKLWALLADGFDLGETLGVA